MLFFLEDGSYLPVSAALRGDFTGLTHRDVPALAEAGSTVTLRFEVNGSTILGDISVLIGCEVAGIPVQILPGELVDTVSSGGG